MFNACFILDILFDIKKKILIKPSHVMPLSGDKIKKRISNRLTLYAKMRLNKKENLNRLTLYAKMRLNKKENFKPSHVMYYDAIQ